MNEIHINGLGVVSPQKTWENDRFLEELAASEGLMLRTSDPNYKDFIPADQIRRMSKIIRMGIAAGKICLADAGCAMPDAIVTGTGFGCIEDTEKFLTTMIRNNEELLTPTSFIQSTHNTVSAQIALLLKCHAYNFTYVHRGASFESALLDAAIRLQSGVSKQVLAGGLDELTQHSFRIMQRMGFWKRKPVNNLNLFNEGTRGTIAGEGASFFLLSPQAGPASYARFVNLDIFPAEMTGRALSDRILTFLQKSGTTPDRVDLLITGRNGDPSHDLPFDSISTELFGTAPQAAFKHLCGEYMTASAFGFWLAAKILKTGTVPEICRYGIVRGRRPETILLWNRYRNTDQSLILLKKS